MDIVSSPEVGRSLPKTIMLVVRSSGLRQTYTQTCPNGTKNFYHGMLTPLHDSMPSFMNFRRVLDLLEFKNQASQCFAGNQRALVLEFHSHLLHGTYKLTQGHTCDFSPTLVYWSMCL